jgi:putative transposase
MIEKEMTICNSHQQYKRHTTTRSKQRRKTCRRAAEVRISVDGRGRWLDNVFVERSWRSLKQEEVHLKAYANGLEACIGIGQWLRFYNDSRPHQALGYKTPAAIWAAEASPVNLPLRLDDAGASPTTPQGQPPQNVISI